MPLLLRLLVLALPLLLSGCGVENDPSKNNDFVPLTAITLTSEFPAIAVGTDCQFTATGDFSGAFSRDISAEVLWSSSDPSVLTIDAAGLARTVAPGISTVTASRDGVSASIVDFQVTTATITAVTVTPASADLVAGQQQPFSASGTFSDDSSQGISRVAAWTSSDTAVATVDAIGLAGAVAGGSAAISATFDGLSGSATLTVSGATLQALTVTPASSSSEQNRAVQFTAIGDFSDGSSLDLTESATWTSEDLAIASVVETTGEVTALSEGTATIRATFDGHDNTAELTVSSVSLDTLTITPATDSVNSGVTLQYSAEGSFSDGSIDDLTAEVTWSSSAPAVATLSNANGSEGLATGVSSGSTTVNASSGTSGIVDSTSLTVN